MLRYGFFFQDEDGIRTAHELLEFRRVLFRSSVLFSVLGGRESGPGYFLASAALSSAISAFSAAISASFALLPPAPGMNAPAACWNISIFRRVSSASGFAPSAPSNAERTSCWFLRSEEHTSELQSLMRISYAVFCLTKKI